MKTIKNFEKFFLNEQEYSGSGFSAENLQNDFDRVKFYLSELYGNLIELDVQEISDIKNRISSILDDFNSVYDDFLDVYIEPDLSPIQNNELVEKWKNDVKVKKTGEHADKTIAELEEELEKLKRKSKKYQEEDKKVPKSIIEQEAEIKFAIRAKRGWPKAKM